MKKAILILFALACCFANPANGQTPDISFFQGKKIVPETSDSGYAQITIKPEAFTIQFQGNELHVCTGLNEDLFLYTAPETDINKDFNSYFYIFKFAAMPANAEYLPVGKDLAAALNKTHGARQAGPDASKFRVSALSIDNEEKPLRTFKAFYMALWLDANKDQYIDKAELLKLKVNITL